MKKRIVPVILALPLLLQAHTMQQLFDALKKQPQTKEDTLLVKEADTALKSTYAKLYPSVGAFARYDYYTTETGLLPVPPNKMFPMIKNPDIPQPFSKRIARVGLSIGMPVFVKSIFTYAKKTEALRASADAARKINLLKNEAIIVGANASLQYLEAMRKALLQKKASLQKTRSFIDMKVKSGRTPASALFKIDDALSQIDISLNDIALQKTKTIQTIQTLTGIRLLHPVSMKETKALDTRTMGILEPLHKKITAERLDLKAQKEKLYPALQLEGSYAKSYAKAYNNDKHIDEHYGNIALVLKMPLLDKPQHTEIEKSRLKLQKARLALARQETSLTAQTEALQRSLKLFDHSLALYRRSVKEKQRLLDIAKVSYKAKRITTEEYLRYEDDLAAQKAKLYRTQAQKWQTLMQLAVIYTNNIEEIVQ